MLIRILIAFLFLNSQLSFAKVAGSGLPGPRSTVTVPTPDTIFPSPDKGVEILPAPDRETPAEIPLDPEDMQCGFNPSQTVPAEYFCYNSCAGVMATQVTGPNRTMAPASAIAFCKFLCSSVSGRLCGQMLKFCLGKVGEARNNKLEQLCLTLANAMCGSKL